MINEERLTWVLDLLVAQGLIHKGQRQDVLNRGRDQARHILLDRRAEMRRLLGRQAVAYRVTEIETIASFLFHRHDDEARVLDEAQITEVVAKELGIPFTHLDPIQLDYKLVTDSIGGRFAERHMVVTMESGKQHIKLAVADPFDRETVDEISRLLNKRVDVVLAPKGDVLHVIAEYHGFQRSMRVAAAELSDDVADLANLEQLVQMKGVSELDGSDQPIIQAVWYLLNYAFEQRASDMHIEPKREEAVVRMRIDGVLHPIHRLPKAVHPAVVSRIKVLSRLDVAERRRPQDGRFKTRLGKTEVELRVSTVPTAFGEKVVIRIFDPGVLLQSIDNLGMFKKELMLFRNMLAASNGMLLVTGPTGSGKTTTLYSSLQHLQSPHVNVVTLEDPIEMVHDEFNQIAMQPKIGLTFASALKNVLRQDPDVIMVGEIRDNETAENAVAAALTGHLVLSTVHTTEAAAAVSRLTDLQVKSFLLSGVLVGVVAQRLVRRVCHACTTEEVLTEEEILQLRIPGARGRKLKVRRGKGCTTCRYTGYYGRTGLFEVMPVTRRIADLISDGATTNEIKREALNDGMLTLREYGIHKIAKGETTVEEVLAATDEVSAW